MNTDESIRFATKYVEDLLSFFGINVAVYSTIEDDVIQLSVPSTSMNSLLIGKNANNLRALQHIVSMTLVARNAEVTRVNIDVADYKRQRADKIEHQAEQWIRQVRATGKERILDLNAADRRGFHRFAIEYSDIETFSTGEGRERRLHIVKKAEKTQIRPEVEAYFLCSQKTEVEKQKPNKEIHIKKRLWKTIKQ